MPVYPTITAIRSIVGVFAMIKLCLCCLRGQRYHGWSCSPLTFLASWALVMQSLIGAENTAFLVLAMPTGATYSLTGLTDSKFYSRSLKHARYVQRGRIATGMLGYSFRSGDNYQWLNAQCVHRPKNFLSGIRRRLESTGPGLVSGGVYGLLRSLEWLKEMLEYEARH